MTDSINEEKRIARAAQKTARAKSVAYHAKLGLSSRVPKRKCSLMIELLADRRLEQHKRATMRSRFFEKHF